jgi:hypothetical protein
MSTVTHGRRGRIAASRQTSSEGAAVETMRLVLALWALAMAERSSAQPRGTAQVGKPTRRERTCMRLRRSGDCEALPPCEPSSAYLRSETQGPKVASCSVTGCPS